MELTNFKEIKDIILKKWRKGDILREYFREKYNKNFLLFPLKIKLKSPTSKELSTDTLEVFNWKKALKETDKSILGYGYNIIEKKINNKIIGKNSIPTHIEILSPEDAIKLIKKELGATSVFGKKSAAPYGIYHFSNSGETTWFDFACAIRDYGKKYARITHDCRVQPCSSDEYKTKAARPAYSVLDCTKIETTLNIKIPSWQASLERCIKNPRFES